MDTELEEFAGIGSSIAASKEKAQKRRGGLPTGATGSGKTHGPRVGIGSMGQASLSEANDSELSQDEREDFHEKRRDQETMARRRRRIDDKYGDTIREYEADIDPTALGPVEKAVARATESLERRRKRHKHGLQHSVFDALLGLRRLEHDDLDLAHLYEDKATGKDVREALRRADEASRRGDTETAKALLEGVLLSSGGDNDTLLAIAGTGENGRPAPHHVAVVDASRREGLEPRQSLAALAASGAVGSEQLLNASGRGGESWLEIGGDDTLLLESTGRAQRGEHDDPTNEAFEVLSRDTKAGASRGDGGIAADARRLNGIVSAID